MSPHDTEPPGNHTPLVMLGLWLVLLALMGALGVVAGEPSERPLFELWNLGLGCVLSWWGLRNGAVEVFGDLFELDTLLFWCWPLMLPWMLARHRGCGMVVLAISLFGAAVLTSLVLGGMLGALLAF